MSTLAVNRQATYDYHILETYEAGMVLVGHEVKSIKKGRISLRGSYVIIRNQECWLINTFIPPYQPQNTPENYDPSRPKKLLLNKKEIRSLIGKTKQKGLTLIPLKVYTKNDLIKLKIGLGQGKRKHDKREIIKKRETDRKISRALREKE